MAIGDIFKAVSNTVSVLQQVKSGEKIAQINWPMIYSAASEIYASVYGEKHDLTPKDIVKIMFKTLEKGKPLKLTKQGEKILAQSKVWGDISEIVQKTRFLRI